MQEQLRELLEESPEHDELELVLQLELELFEQLELLEHDDEELELQQELELEL